MLYSNSNIKVLVPLRGGSKGIKKKNLKYFLDKPLCFWVIQAALEINLKVYISTENKEIKEKVKNAYPKVIIQNRPNEFASDNSSTEDVINFFIEGNKCDHIILLQATSPLTTSKNISSALDLYFEKGCKPLLSGTRQHIFAWSNDGNPMNYNPNKRPRRQDWEGTFIENGAIYIFKAKDFLKVKSRCKVPCTLFEMDYLNSFELDSKSDWHLLEYLVKNKYSSK
tara:strand:+ start:49 stop:723 length:675 start_codon:yes stop_codon:yes gene_type:complete